jgi:hypothetical protein
MMLMKCLVSYLARNTESVTKTLKNEVNELTRALSKAYSGEDRLLMCLGNQRASLYKEGLDYTSKKGKVVSAPHKTSFMKNNGRFYTSCK